MSTIIDEDLLIPDRWGCRWRRSPVWGTGCRTAGLAIEVVSRPRREMVRNMPGPTCEDFLK